MRCLTANDPSDAGGSKKRAPANKVQMSGRDVSGRKGAVHLKVE
jgi:hypothetical protein